MPLEILEDPRLRLIARTVARLGRLPMNLKYVRVIMMSTRLRLFS
jgi:hypothetical protein